MDKMICKILGHKINDIRYGRIELNDVDGIGRQHATVKYACERCYKTFTVCRVHIPYIEEPTNG